MEHPPRNQRFKPSVFVLELVGQPDLPAGTCSLLPLSVTFLVLSEAVPPVNTIVLNFLTILGHR